jgi:hypothetical protein
MKMKIQLECSGHPEWKHTTHLFASNQ